MNTRSRTVPAALAVLCLLALTRCTGTDVLTTGNFQVQFETTISNPGTLPYDCVLVDFFDVKLRPTDAQAAQFLGSDSINLALNLNEVNFTETDCSFSSVRLPSITLSAGEYLIESFSFGSTQLSHDDSGTFLQCQTSVDPASDPCPACFSPPKTFRVGADQTNRVRILLDVAELEAIAQADPFCQDLRDRVNDVIEIQ